MRGTWWAALMAGCVVLPVALETSGIAHPISSTCEGAEEGLVATIDKSQSKAIEFLKTSQMKDGSWTTPRTSGITALVVYSLIDAGVPVTDPVVAKGLERIAAYSQPTGEIAAPGSPHAGYETSVSILALAVGNADGKYTEVLKKAEAYARGMQMGEETNTEKSDVAYGGAGYKAGGGRPDLSNTVFFLDALKATGATAEDPAVQKALVFLSRCQNLESEFNTTPQAAKINDGGFYYNPNGPGVSPAGKSDEGGLRSYGSMTYAGFKSMLYAGLKPDDPRVTAAIEWIGKNYTVEENPGMGAGGLYYYYYLFAKAMDAYGVDEFKDAAQKPHAWRAELAAQLIKLQQANGSWVNDKSSRWMEGDPNLVTAYALVALNRCAGKK
jgi:squalene-hopene/tetraprenyl-beta-curcumene cyclase